MALVDKYKCFVIMPISKSTETHTKEYWAKHFNTFLKPLIESNPSLSAERSSPLRGDILREIITELLTAYIVVADLTDANPNVYWELGVRQSFKHNTITIAENGTDIPFDLGIKGTLFYYPDDYIKMQEFRNDFNKAIKDCIENPNMPDSHVLETIGGRGTLHQILIRDESLRRLEALISEVDYNQVTFDKVINRCKKNIKLREEKKSGERYSTDLLRTSAVELLIVNRYIDAEKDLYELGESYVNILSKINARIIDWPSRPKPIEHWLLLEEDGCVSTMKLFKKEINDSIELIEKSL